MELQRRQDGEAGLQVLTRGFGTPKYKEGWNSRGSHTVAER